jgi:hypothetical protein
VLTRQEETAGISRKALETLNRLNATPNTNGNGNGKGSAAVKRTRTVAEIISGCIANRVIDTPMRQVDILERVNHGDIVIRDTAFEMHRATVTSVFLSYHEAAALSKVLADLEPRQEMTAPVTKG